MVNIAVLGYGTVGSGVVEEPIMNQLITRPENTSILNMCSI